jgi:hypothetical protein
MTIGELSSGTVSTGATTGVSTTARATGASGTIGDGEEILDSPTPGDAGVTGVTDDSRGTGTTGVEITNSGVETVMNSHELTGAGLDDQSDAPSDTGIHHDDTVSSFLFRYMRNTISPPKSMSQTTPESIKIISLDIGPASLMVVSLFRNIRRVNPISSSARLSPKVVFWKSGSELAKRRSRWETRANDARSLTFLYERSTSREIPFSVRISFGKSVSDRRLSHVWSVVPVSVARTFSSSDTVIFSVSPWSESAQSVYSNGFAMIPSLWFLSSVT